MSGSGPIIGAPNLALIDAITQFVGGTQTVWNTITIPIPAGLVVYATDTTALKIGDGSTLYVNLPVILTLNTLTTMVNAITSVEAGGVVTPSEMAGAIATAMTTAGEWTAGPVHEIVGGSIIGGVLTITGGGSSGEWTAGVVNSIVGATLVGGVLTFSGGTAGPSGPMGPGFSAATVNSSGHLTLEQVTAGVVTGTVDLGSVIGPVGPATALPTLPGSVGTYAIININGSTGSSAFPSGKSISVGYIFSGPNLASTTVMELSGWTDESLIVGAGTWVIASICNGYMLILRIA